MKTRTFKTKNWNNRIYIKEIIFLTQEDIDKKPFLYAKKKVGDIRLIYEKSGYIEKNGANYEILKATKEDKKLYQILIANCKIKDLGMKQKFIIDDIEYIIQCDYWSN
jgi:hypothetical protein